MTTEHVFDNGHLYQSNVKHEKHIWAQTNNTIRPVKNGIANVCLYYSSQRLLTLANIKSSIIIIIGWNRLTAQVLDLNLIEYLNVINTIQSTN